MYQRLQESNITMQSNITWIKGS